MGFLSCQGEVSTHIWFHVGILYCLLYFMVGCSPMIDAQSLNKDHLKKYETWYINADLSLQIWSVTQGWLTTFTKQISAA